MARASGPLRRGLAVALAIGASTATNARADDSTALLEQLFSEGRKLMAAGRVAEACPKFLASYNIEHRVGTLLSLADCYEQNRQFASAWARFLDAKTLASRSNQTERADYATKHAAALEARRSMLTIVVSAPVPGLVVARDGLNLDPATYGVAVPIDGGTHTIVVTAPGKKRISSTITVAPEADQKTYAVPHLDDLAVEGVVVASAPPRPSRWTTQKTLAIASGAVGLAGVGVGTAFGFIASSDASSQHAACGNAGCPNHAAALSDHSSSITAGNVSTAMFIVGGGGIAGAITLWLTSPRREASTSALGVAPLVGGGLYGFSMSGMFE